MRGLHLTRHLITPLLGGLTNDLAIPGELVPVDLASFVDHRFDPLVLLLLLENLLGLVSHMHFVPAFT